MYGGEGQMGNERRAFLLGDTPRATAFGKRGFGWRFAESLILSLPAADATREGTEEGCVCRRKCCWIFRQQAFTLSTVPWQHGYAVRAVRKAHR